MDAEAGFLLRDSVVLAVEVLECCPWCAPAPAPGAAPPRPPGRLSRTRPRTPAALRRRVCGGRPGARAALPAVRGARSQEASGDLPAGPGRVATVPAQADQAPRLVAAPREPPRSLHRPAAAFGAPSGRAAARRFEFADLEVYASDEDGAASASTEADEGADGTDSGSDAADEVDAFFCTLIRAGRARSAAPGRTLEYQTVGAALCGRCRAGARMCRLQCRSAEPPADR